MTLTAITDRDLPVITGVILLSALVFVVVNTVVDLVVPLIDPRLRRRPGAGRTHGGALVKRRGQAVALGIAGAVLAVIAVGAVAPGCSPRTTRC